MALTPYASADAGFATGVDYVFRVRRVTAPNPLTLDSNPVDVTCTFDGAAVQKVHCTAPAGLSAEATVGDPAGGGPTPAMRVFAGLRSDPAFFDWQGALATVARGRTELAGRNAFAGANVLAIVVEIDARAAFVPAVDAGSDAADGGEGGSPVAMPILAVAAETERRAF